MGDTYKASGKPRQSSNAVADAVNAVSDYMRASREDKGPSINKAENDQLTTLDASNSSNVASNAGRQAQSTDHQNQY